MKVKFIGRGSYYAHPFLFTEKNREIEVDDKLGEYLSGTSMFKAIDVPEKGKKEEERPEPETQKEVEEKESKEKKKLEESKTSKKK